MFIPYQVDVPMERWPIANFLLIGCTSLVSLGIIVSVIGSGSAQGIVPYVLDGWSIRGLFGHMFIHGGFLHLIGNMIFLWVFGNAICAKVGNLQYLGIYLGLGLLAAAAHNLFAGGRAIGASGAINGVVGMFLILYPTNDITMLWYYFFRGGSFTLSSFWMILLWLAFDIWGAASGGGGVAYWAHLGGFAAGAAIAIALLQSKVIEMSDMERSLLDVINRR